MSDRTPEASTAADHRTPRVRWPATTRTGFAASAPTAQDRPRRTVVFRRAGFFAVGFFFATGFLATGFLPCVFALTLRLTFTLHFAFALVLAFGFLLALAAEDRAFGGRRGRGRRRRHLRGHRDRRAAAGARVRAATGLRDLVQRAHLVVVLARVRVDRVVAAVADLELDHHVVVLVHQVVAVHHVLADLVLELHDHADLLGLTDVDDVLRAELVGLRGLAVAVEDLEVDQVDVDRVEPAAARVLELPDLDLVLLRVGDRQLVLGVDDVLPGLAVDGPVAVLALEADVAGARRLRLLEAHDLHVGVEVLRDLVVAVVVGLAHDLERHDDVGV